MTSPALPAPGTTDGPAIFTATYEMTEAELVRGARYITQRQLNTWLGAALLVAMPVAQWAGQVGPEPDVLTATLAVVAIIGVGAIWRQPLLQVRRVRRNLPTPNGPYTLTLQESGLTIASAMGSNSMIWSFVKAIGENDEFVLLYVSKAYAYLLPKKVLSKEQIDAFWWVVGRWAPHLVRDSRRA